MNSFVYSSAVTLLIYTVGYMLYDVYSLYLFLSFCSRIA